MSGGPLTLAQLGGSDRSGAIRDTAVQVLRSYAPLGSIIVSRARVDPMQSGDMPAINVFLHRERRVGVSKGVGAPAYQVYATIGVQLLVERAQLDDAVAELDALRVAALEGLLSDPIWPRLDNAMPDGDLTFELDFRSKGERIVGEALASIECGPWTETYDPRVTPILRAMTLNTDAGRPFDPTGAYSDDQIAGFPPAAAPPRPSGPDGRIEIGGTITFPAN